VWAGGATGVDADCAIVYEICTMSARTSTPAVVERTLDRRVARAVATRTAVVNALLRLLEEGDLRPTAPRIAARAGVSLRSVFQHFADLESLFAAAADRQTEKILQLGRRLDSTGPLHARVAAFVAQRQRILETVAPVRRAALLMEPFSAEIHARLTQARALGRVELERVFAPELQLQARAERSEVLDAMAAASSFSAWEVLRVHHGSSVSRAGRVLARTLGALLQSPAPAAAASAARPRARPSRPGSRNTGRRQRARTARGAGRADRANG
jgi:AcrR family transcriptional regulator